MPVFVLPIGNAARTHPLNLSVLEKSVHVESALQIQADLVILLINMKSTELPLVSWGSEQ